MSDALQDLAERLKAEALELPEAGPGDDPLAGLYSAWLDESYQVVAPKTLVKRLDAEQGSGT